MNDFLKNIYLVFSNYRYVLFFLFLFFALFFLFEFLTDDALVKGNLGITYFYVNFVLQVGISFLFASFFTFFVYKYITFSTFDKKTSATSFLGTIFGVLVGGCAACSLTVASYLGLGSVIAFFPYHGIELKLFGFLMLIYANFMSIRDLQICRLNFNTKKKKSP
jgi:hypothetical protein